MNQRVYALSGLDKLYQHNKKHHWSDNSFGSLRRKKERVIQSRLPSGSSRAKLNLAGKVRKSLLVIPY